MKRVFISYSHMDAPFRDALVLHLQVLCTAGIITQWHDGEIGPGEDWKASIDREIGGADIVVLLVSASFLASRSCNVLELAPALERWKTQAISVLPVIVRACDWAASPVARLQVLPAHGRPVATWPHQDDAWTEVTQTIRTMATAPVGKEGLLMLGASRSSVASAAEVLVLSKPTPAVRASNYGPTSLGDGPSASRSGSQDTARLPAKDAATWWNITLLPLPLSPAAWALRIPFLLIVTLTVIDVLVTCAVLASTEHPAALLLGIPAPFLVGAMAAIRAWTVGINKRASGSASAQPSSIEARSEHGPASRPGEAMELPSSRSRGISARRTDRHRFLSECAPLARSLFAFLLDEAARRQYHVYWGTTGFSLGAHFPDPSERWSFAYGYPPDDFQFYFQDGAPWSHGEEASAFRRELMSIGIFREAGRFTLKSNVREDTEERVREAVAHIFTRVDDSIKTARTLSSTVDR